MKYLPLIFILCVVLLLSLVGCSTVADFYDSQDPCQTKPYPNWCGASDGDSVIRNNRGERIGTISKD